MKNKLLPTILIILGLILINVLVFFISPGEIINNLSIFNKFNNNTSLLIKTQNGKLSIEIDGEEQGETPLEITTLNSGQHSIKLTRISSQQDVFYEPVTYLIDLTNNTEAIMDIEIGPAGSNIGYILQYSPSPFGDKKSYLTIESNTQADTILDELSFGQTPTKVKEISEGEHTLTVSSDGYEELEVPLVGAKGFNLNVQTYLYPIPINLELNEVSEEN
jgi:hypothetical protein